MTQSGTWGYRYPIVPETLVLSRPCTTVGALYKQKRRWGVGGKEMSVSGFMIMAVGFLMHGLLLGGFFLGIGIPFLAASVVIKLFCDILLLRIPLQRLGRMADLRYLLSFELYFILYVILLPFAVFLGGAVVWKGRKY
jgi:cellulose synthase/poly-beta-1,6-N-acetylglucosamine synthase-like glycosyltransferase